MKLTFSKLKDYISEGGVAAYLALAFSALCILLTVLLVAVIGLASSDQIKNRIGNSLADMAVQTSDKLDRGVFERYREIQLLSMHNELTASAGHIAQQRQQLEALQKTYPHYAWIGMTDEAGKIVVSTSGILEGQNVSGRPWFNNAINGTFVTDAHEALLLSNLLPHTEFLPSERMRFLDVAFPYRDQRGQFAGVLGAHLSWRWAREITESIIAPLGQRRNVDALIISREGKVLLGPEAMLDTTLKLPSLNAARKAVPGYITETWPDKQRYLVGYSVSKGYQSYPGQGWTVIVRQNEKDAFFLLKRVQTKVLFSGIGLAVLFSLLGVLAARRLTLPLRELAQSAQKIKNGESAVIAPHGMNYREVKMLTASLNLLVGDLLKKESALKDLNQTLEKRVELRTSELKDALTTLTAKEERIHNILNTAHDAFIGVDLHGNICDWNSQAEKMFGWSRQEVLGKQMSSLIIPERFQASNNAIIKRVSEEGQCDFIEKRLERIVIDRQNHEFQIEMTWGLVYDKGSYFFSAFLHDISDRKEVERMKNEFISTVSHELRTPLTSIRGSIGLLVGGGMADSLPPHAQTLLQIANKNCERLVRMVNDVLDIEKIESGNMHFEMVNQLLLPLAQQAIDATQGYAAQFNVVLALENMAGQRDIRAAVDRDSLIRVLINLLSNAIKFSPDQGTVTMRILSFDNEGQNWVRLSVFDQGDGVPHEFRKRIFQKFAMADSADSRKKGGTGLGLNISKNVVEKHGGQIDFVSEAGSPTEFFINLPLLNVVVAI